jgi:hypothetical protein
VKSWSNPSGQLFADIRYSALRSNSMSSAICRSDRISAKTYRSAGLSSGGNSNCSNNRIRLSSKSRSCRRNKLRMTVLFQAALACARLLSSLINARTYVNSQPAATHKRMSRPAGTSGNRKAGQKNTPADRNQRGPLI